MQKLLILLALTIILSVSVFGQNDKFRQDPEDQKVPSQNKGTRERVAKDDKKQPQSEMKDVLLESGTNLDAKLLSTLDVKKSEVGDEVVLKTTKSIKQNGDVVIPKGTKLIGRITDVKRKTKNDKSSKISMVFDRLQNKNLTAPINASIVAIAKAGANVQATDLFGGSVEGNSRPTGRSSSGGLLGGTTNTVGGVLTSTTKTVGGVANTAGRTVGGTTNTVGRTFDGIQISQTANASVSGSSTLTAENKNIRLQKGTQFQLQLNESVQK